MRKEETAQRGETYIPLPTDRDKDAMYIFWRSPTAHHSVVVGFFKKRERRPSSSETLEFFGYSQDECVDGRQRRGGIYISTPPGGRSSV